MNNVLKDFKFPETNVWLGNPETGMPPYVLSDQIKIALKVALVTNRPLLVSGLPGSGKTTLAKVIAESQGWSYLKHTLTSRSRLEDLTGEVDQLQRLHDAHTAISNENALMPDWAYLKPGLFWWGFDPISAQLKGREPEEFEEQVENGIKQTTPPKTLQNNAAGIVILLDEIDKAEPDLPNDLLEPLDRRSFQLPDGTEIKATDDLHMLVVITTNGERDLPPAFLRRCIHLELQSPDSEALQQIADFHFKTEECTYKQALFAAVAEKFSDLVKVAKDTSRRPPGTSEYLDAVRACLELGITPENEIWQQVEQATLKKQPKQAEDA
ncbi:MoxR family ATPase [Thiothrix sp.]|jgi:MoxR-like ATPase|uniref:AAA family ATPase n=1 Tax=Thiothrix sp. TaxID=1032 RepID=UPI00257DDDAC|nr:MoxR family ATPase [Thiothrix sp.]